VVQAESTRASESVEVQPGLQTKGNTSSTTAGSTTSDTASSTAAHLQGCLS
jgi:hypothetical protein